MQDCREGLGHLGVLGLGVRHVTGHAAELQISVPPLDLGLALIGVFGIARVDLRRESE